MKILITGTAGFIGSHLAIKLLNRGDEVVGLDNINDYYDQNVKYGRLQRGGIIDSLEEGVDIPYGQVIVSKTNPKYKFIPIIMLTTESDPTIKQRGKSLGVKAWMLKPFNKEKFFTAVKKLLN